MEQEIKNINKERADQAARFEGEINSKDIMIKCKCYHLKKTDLDHVSMFLELHSTNEEMKFEVSELQANLHIEALEEQLGNLLESNQRIYSEKAKLMDDLETAAQYINELEGKIYTSNGTSLELLKQLKDSEEEIEALKTYIIDLKSRIAVYIPVKNDSTDKKLAEYINNYPERSKLKIMFMRESEGIYQFGTKKVYVRVDHDKINIRVGGGYLSIDEFLDQYTPVELEKLESRSPLRRFNEKVAVQKTINNRQVRESSPVQGRSSPSPTRKSTAKRRV